MLQLQQSDYPKVLPSGLVLTGGSANLLGFAELGSRITRLPVRIGMPITLYGVSDILHDPAYATSVGLLLWRLRNRGVRSWRPKGAGRVLSGMFRLFD